MLISILFAILTSSADTSAAARAVDHCEQYDQHVLMKDLLVSLADKLFYEYAEFCTNERIADIYHENKLVYHKEDDSYHPYEFVTVHYYEYSCEYQFNLEAQQWASQSCYNTW